MEKCTAGLAVLYGGTTGFSSWSSPVSLTHCRPPAVNKVSSTSSTGICRQHADIRLLQSVGCWCTLWAGVSMYWWRISLDVVQPLSVEPCQGWIAVTCLLGVNIRFRLDQSTSATRLCCAASISGPWPWCAPWCWCHNDCTGHCRHQSLLCRSVSDRKRAAVTDTRIRVNAGSFVDRRQGWLLQHSAC